MDITLERLKANAIEAGKTPNNHYYDIVRIGLDNKLAFNLYDKHGQKISCWTKSEQRKYPKRSAHYAQERLKALEINKGV